MTNLFTWASRCEEEASRASAIRLHCIFQELTILGFRRQCRINGTSNQPSRRVPLALSIGPSTAVWHAALLYSADAVAC